MLITPVYKPIPPLEANKLLTNDGTVMNWTDSPILVSATFSDPVTGVFPVVGSDFATKEYVDLAGLSGKDYWLSNTASGIGSNYIMYPAETGEAEAILTSAALAEGDDQLIFAYITEANEPDMLKIRAGIYGLHTHLSRGVGDKPATVYWTLTKVDADGTSNETLLMTSEDSDAIGTTMAAATLHASITTGVTLDAPSRLILKLYANVGASGGDCEIKIYMEGAHDCHLSIQVPSSIWQNQGDELDKINAGTAPTLASLVLGADPSVISSAYAIQIKPSGDAANYITLSSPGGIPTLGVVGAPVLSTSGLRVDGTLTLTSGSIIDTSGEIDFDNENLTTSGVIISTNAYGIQTNTIGQGTDASFSVVAGEGKNANIFMNVDEADDDNDKFFMGTKVGTPNYFAINTKATGSWVEFFKITNAGDVTVTGELQGGRCLLGMGESLAFTADRYLDFYNGQQSSSHNGYVMTRAGQVIGVSCSMLITDYTAASSVSIKVRKNGVLVFEALQNVTVNGIKNFHDNQTRAAAIAAGDTFVAGDVLTLYVDFQNTPPSFTAQDVCAIMELQFDT